MKSRTVKILAIVFALCFCISVQAQYVQTNPLEWLALAEGNEAINMLEVNTTPGMTTTSFIPQQVRAAGLDIKDVLTEIIENQF